HAGTGEAHSLINNGETDAHVFVFSEAFRRNSRARHPNDEAADEGLKKMGMFWTDAPAHKLGPNRGKPGDLSGRKRTLPKHVSNWRDIIEKKSNHYANSTEDQTIPARFGRRARIARIGVHLDMLKPGRRTSYPHAERDEDEFVYVISGNADCWLDGHLHPIGAGDFVGFAAGTGITHTIINNSDADVFMLVGSEGSRLLGQYWYPCQPSQNKAIGGRYWADHPVPKLGPHDGLPDALRARLPKAARRNAIAANEAARHLQPARKSKTKR
ncbi:MAG TPA: cupin domain-containing protein, partial [Rhizomicrobium sp.]